MRVQFWTLPGGEKPPATVKVWDPFVRVFHWSLAGLFLLAYATGDEIENVHIAAGYTITVPFRTWQTYAGLVDWNRYQLIPQIGMSLLVAGLVGADAKLRGGLNGRMLLWFLAALALWTVLQSGTALRLYV